MNESEKLDLLFRLALLLWLGFNLFLNYMHTHPSPIEEHRIEWATVAASWFLWGTVVAAKVVMGQ